VRRKIRLVLVYLSFMLFPVTLNWFSPYVSVTGAMDGIISGSLLMFAVLFVSGMFLGRAWCGWLCPGAGLGEIAQAVNNKPANVYRLKAIRYTIFAVWFAVLCAGFVMAGGVKGIKPLFLMESGVSVDEPARFILYYMILLFLLALDLLLGRRGSCHSVCWMAPFLNAGRFMGKALQLPQLMIRSDPARCVSCGACDRHCPMSISVNTQAGTGAITSPDCALCGQCVDACPHGTLRFGRAFYKNKNNRESGKGDKA
jgi:ferredoxin-type protein NapH